MADLFVGIVNMSINAVWVIAAVIILRFFLKNVSKRYMMFLWALVGVRLVCPFTVESVLSLLPSAKVVSNVSSELSRPVIVSGIDSVDNMINPIMRETFDTPVESGMNKSELFFSMAGCVWCVMLAYILLYLAGSYLYMKKKTGAKMYYDDKIWLCDDINTPFILGVLKPQIYLPSVINPVQSDYVIKHERMHIRYYDYIWKPLGFLILAIHWFNPFVWAAYILFGRDMELACDERVIRDMNFENRKDYSRALLELSAGRQNIAACPLAFGEVGVKQRIKKVLNYRKPAFWAGVVAAAACIAVAACFLTNPISSANESADEIQSADEAVSEISPELDKAVSDAILGEDPVGPEQEYVCEDHVILGVSKPQDGIVDVYAMVLCNGYVMSDNGIEESGGYHMPRVITFVENEDGSYMLKDMWQPRDGSGYESSIRGRFPHDICDNAMDTQKYINEQQQRCHAKAEHHFSQNAGSNGNSGDTEGGIGTPDSTYEPGNGYHHEANYRSRYVAECREAECREAECRHSETDSHYGISPGKFEDVKAYLAGLPEEVDALTDAGCFVMTYGGVTGVENWNNFSRAVNSGESADLVCVQFTVEGDLIFDYMYYTETNIYHVCDFRRDKFSAGSEEDKCYEETFNYIKVFDIVENDGDKVKYIALTDKADLTFDEFAQTVYSDDYNPDNADTKIIANITYGNEHADITGEETWHDVSYEYDMSKRLLDSKKVHSIVVTKGDTGETQEFKADDVGAFNELLIMYVNLNAKPWEYDDIVRSGYAYKMELRDKKGEFLQTVVPYKDAVSIDYQMYDCRENSSACRLLMALDALGWKDKQ